MRRRPARKQHEGPWLITTPGRVPVAMAAARIMLCAALISGPAGLAVSLGRTPEAQPRSQAIQPVHDATGPAGFAELYVAAYLTTGGDADALRPFFPDAGTTEASTGLVVERTTVTDVREPIRGHWRVTVAAAIARPSPEGPLPAGLRYFTAPITASSGTARREYVATALPSEVARPAEPRAPETGYEEFSSLATGPAADTVRRFLAAYLTGSGELTRYLAPGTSLAPAAPAPYRSLELRSVAPQNGTATSPAPDDGTRLRVLAAVEARDGTGATWPMQYALTLTGRSGRWEVAAIDDVPLLEPGRPGS